MVWLDKHCRVVRKNATTITVKLGANQGGKSLRFVASSQEEADAWMKTLSGQIEAILKNYKFDAHSASDVAKVSHDKSALIEVLYPPRFSFSLKLFASVQCWCVCQCRIQIYVSMQVEQEVDEWVTDEEAMRKMKKRYDRAQRKDAQELMRLEQEEAETGLIFESMTEWVLKRVSCCVFCVARISVD